MSTLRREERKPATIQENAKFEPVTPYVKGVFDTILENPMDGTTPPRGRHIPQGTTQYRKERQSMGRRDRERIERIRAGLEKPIAPPKPEQPRTDSLMAMDISRVLTYLAVRGLSVVDQTEKRRR